MNYKSFGINTVEVFFSTTSIVGIIRHDMSSKKWLVIDDKYCQYNVRKSAIECIAIRNIQQKQTEEAQGVSENIEPIPGGRISIPITSETNKKSQPELDSDGERVIYGPNGEIVSISDSNYGLPY